MFLLGDKGERKGEKDRLSLISIARLLMLVYNNSGRK
jgi:hypothetical protein